MRAHTHTRARSHTHTHTRTRSHHAHATKSVREKGRGDAYLLKAKWQEEMDEHVEEAEKALELAATMARELGQREQANGGNVTAGNAGGLADMDVDDDKPRDKFGHELMQAGSVYVVGWKKGGRKDGYLCRCG